MTTTPAASPPVEHGPDTGGVVSSGWLAADSMFGSDDKRAKRAVGASLATFLLHGLFLLIAVLVLTYQAREVITTQEPLPEVRVVYLQQPGPGGGGGGSPAPAAPKPLAIPKVKAPDPIPIVPPPPQTVPPPPIPTLMAPITTNATSIQAQGSSSVSLSAYGGGGRGGGLGSGTGNGVGPGTGGGFGGGAYQPGAGIVSPEPIRKPSPKYTADAMRLKIQGSVEVEAVVNADGSVGDLRIIKSLDRSYGLDQEALAAAKQWFFRPGRDRDGKAVPVIVTIAFDLRLH